LFAGGYSYDGSVFYLNVIDYVTIATLGNAADFGDLTVGRYTVAGASSTTRALFAGGYFYDGFDNFFNVIDYVTIATLGNATDFGDLTNNVCSAAGASSTTRALFAGGYNEGDGYSDIFFNVIDYVTIATLGNAADFGDLTVSRDTEAGASSKIRAIFAGGYDLNFLNVIDYVTIATLGNAADFGDLTVGRDGVAGASDSHGGL
jgi:hypothetical protein